MGNLQEKCLYVMWDKGILGIPRMDNLNDAPTSVSTS